MLTLNRLETRPPATSAPISVDDLKVHLRLFGDDSVSDEYLLSLIGTSLELASNILGETIGPSVYDAFFTDFNNLKLPQNYVELILAVQYYDEDNNLVTLDSSTYFLDNSATTPEVKFNKGATPQVTLNSFRTGKVKVQYETLYLNAGPVVSQAMLIIASDLYTNQTGSTDKQSFKTPVAAKNLLSTYRRQRW